jgi:hypothetical protein
MQSEEEQSFDIIGGQTKVVQVHHVHGCPPYAACGLLDAGCMKTSISALLQKVYVGNDQAAPEPVAFSIA